MNATAAFTDASVSVRPRSAVAVLTSRALHTPVSVMSFVDVPFPVEAALSASARNTRVAVGSPAATSGRIFWRCGSSVNGAVRATLMFTRLGVR